MRRNVLLIATALILAANALPAHAQEMSEERLRKLKILPDPSLTPGEANTDITQANIADNICNRNWRTSSLRDNTTSAAEKASTYGLYHIPHPANNTGQNQTCELDHLISLENGGSDGLNNIWPECGPANVTLNQRWFKKKDAVENYVHKGICLNVPDAKFSMGPKPSKSLTLAEGQKILSANWYVCYLAMAVGDDCN